MTNKIYIINNEIEFWPDKKLVRLVNAPESYYILNTPAAKCFELLITRRDLVSHKDLYEYAWEKEAFEPSPNTLYQNMSILRRGLRKIGVSNPDIIATVARKGFKLKDSTRITVSEEDASEVLPVANDGELLEGITDKSIVDKKYNLLKHPVIISGFFGVLIVLLLLYNFSDHYSARSPISDYELITKNDGCFFYVNKESDIEVDSKIITSVSGCKNYPYNYITQFDFMSNYSLLSCNLPLAEKSKKTVCRAIYHRGYNDE